MKRSSFPCNRIACAVVAGAVMMVGIFFVLLGLTLLPVIGIFIGIPVICMSLCFLKPEAHVSTEEVASRDACEDPEALCPWPPAPQHGFSTAHREAAA